jgi:exodeoxyribonuclease VII large subunit
LAETSARLGSPKGLLRDAGLRLQGPAGQLDQLFRAQLRERQREFSRLSERLTLDELATRLPRHRSSLADLGARTDHAFQARLTKAKDRLASAGSLLSSYSYQGVLARGFALVRDDKGKPITSAADAAKKSRIELEFTDGRTPAMIASDQPVTGKRKTKTPKDGDGGQGRLL